MDLILNIDTAIEGASVSLAAEGKEIGTLQTATTYDSASWLHVAIRKLTIEHGIALPKIKAIGISMGPGSYTGLRVGMSAAKGLCYALSIPLVGVNTLELMASAVTEPAGKLLCPMIDARRMEVFTAVYKTGLEVVRSPSNLILETGSFEELLEHSPMLFFGNGSQKWRTMADHKNAHFEDLTVTAAHLAPLSFRLYRSKTFLDLAYSEPIYGKEFYSPPPRPLV